MRATVHDVARHANVSISTVSRVLNDSAPVREDKRERVLEAIRALNFVPHPAARSLLGHQTGTIGAVLPYITGEFFADLLSGLDAATQAHERMLMVSASHRHESSFVSALASMDARVDGLIVMAPELSADRVLELAPSNVPIVFLNTRSDEAKVHATNFDNRGGMHALSLQLVEAGHRCFAFLCGPEGSHDAQERLSGFRSALPDGAHAVELAGDFSADCGYDAAGHILGMIPRPTAVVAANDLSALGALRAFHERGVAVPDEVALAGFDDIPSARFTTPPLTSVRVPISALAAQAVERLVSLIADPATLPRVHLATLEPVYRESTAYPPIADIVLPVKTFS